MEIKLIRIGIDEAEKLWEMQIKAFQSLYEKYQDTKTSPATETVDKIIMRLNQPFTYYYFINVYNVDRHYTCAERSECASRSVPVGAMRVVDKKEEDKPKKISPIFIMPEYRNRGYAQKSIELAERIHGNSDWELETILQEKGNCYLYEKMGYRQTGKTERINDKLTLVFYKKD